MKVVLTDLLPNEDVFAGLGIRASREPRSVTLSNRGHFFFPEYASFRINNIYFLREDKFPLRNVTLTKIFTQSWSYRSVNEWIEDYNTSRESSTFSYLDSTNMKHHGPKQPF